MEQLGINLGLLIVQIIAFIIVFLTLNAWVYEPMLNMMESRKQKIAQGLEDAREAAEARANAEKDADKIRGEAQAEAAKIVREATERAALAGQDVHHFMDHRQFKVSIRIVEGDATILDEQHDKPAGENQQQSSGCGRPAGQQ